MTGSAAALTETPQPDNAVPILTVKNLQAHFRTHHFGVKRYVRAVDGISFDVRRGEIYGLAGESSSGKTTLIKTIAGAIRRQRSWGNVEIRSLKSWSWPPAMQGSVTRTRRGSACRRASS